MTSSRTVRRAVALGFAVAAVTAGTALSATTATAAPAPAPRTAAMVTSALATLQQSASVPGTAWATDPTTNQVVLTLDSTVTGAKLATVQKAVSRLGNTVRVQHTAGTFSLRTRGGDAIYISQYRCSAGFNVRSGSTYYFLTAGHCGNLGSTWYSDQAHTTSIGTTSGSSFPGNDYAIVKYKSGVSHPGTVNLYNGSTQDITRSANATVGERVSRSGSTTGVHTGTVTGLNATVNYSEGRVSGLIQTNVCAEGGDSGGALFDGSTALGLTSGGSGNCTSGGTTFFQPVTEALSVYGVSVY